VTPTDYQYEFKGFGDAEPINGGRWDKILCPTDTWIKLETLAEKCQLAPEMRNLLGQVALYGRGLLAEKATSLLEAAAPLRDILGDMLWHLGYIQDANGWSVNIQSRAQADNIAQEILRQNPQGRLCSFVAAMKARRAVRVPGQSSEVTQAVMAISAYNARAAWAANAVRARERGEPLPPPPVPPSSKGLDFGNGLALKDLEGLADLIVSAPEAERATLQLHTVELLAGWLLRKGQAVGPDGRIIVGVRTPEEASKIVAGWINDEFARQKSIESDETEAPVSSQEPEYEGPRSAHLSDIEEAPQFVVIPEKDILEPEVRNRFYRSGDTWITSYQGENGSHAHQVGWDYILHYLRHAGEEINNIQMETLGNYPASAGCATLDDRFEDDRFEDLDASDSSASDDDSNAVIDRKSMEAYKKRLREIRDETATAERKGEAVEVARLRNEFEQLAQHIRANSQAIGRATRRRRFSDDEEKARQRVSAAVRRVYKQMESNHCPKTVAYFKHFLKLGKPGVLRDINTTWILDKPTKAKA
jgi:hypothetical protein